MRSLELLSRFPRLQLSAPLDSNFSQCPGAERMGKATEPDQWLPDADELEIAFGPFRLFPARRLLLNRETSVRLGGRAFDLLVALVKRRGELVGKFELIATVWPNIAIEEGNLKVHIAALRRTLRDGEAGNRYISTVVGRGYCFVAPIAQRMRAMGHLAPINTTSAIAFDV